MDRPSHSSSGSARNMLWIPAAPALWVLNWSSQTRNCCCFTRFRPFRQILRWNLPCLAWSFFLVWAWTEQIPARLWTNNKHTLLRMWSQSGPEGSVKEFVCGGNVIRNKSAGFRHKPYFTVIVVMLLNVSHQDCFNIKLRTCSHVPLLSALNLSLD